MQINGNKTNLGIILIVVGEVLARVLPEYADLGMILSDLGKGLAGIGIVHKYEKSRQDKLAPANTGGETDAS